MLVRVRNEIVHYKMSGPAPSFIKGLEQRGIVLPRPKEAGDADYAWARKISCTEGIRWAHNTACRVVRKLAEFAPQDHRAYIAGVDNFQEISMTDVEAWLTAMSSRVDT